MADPTPPANPPAVDSATYADIADSLRQTAGVLVNAARMLEAAQNAPKIAVEVQSVEGKLSVIVRRLAGEQP